MENNTIYLNYNKHRGIFHGVHTLKSSTQQESYILFIYKSYLELYTYSATPTLICTKNVQNFNIACLVFVDFDENRQSFPFVSFNEHSQFVFGFLNVHNNQIIMTCEDNKDYSNPSSLSLEPTKRQPAKEFFYQFKVNAFERLTSIIPDKLSYIKYDLEISKITIKHIDIPTFNFVGLFRTNTVRIIGILLKHEEVLIKEDTSKCLELNKPGRAGYMVFIYTVQYIDLQKECFEGFKIVSPHNNSTAFKIYDDSIYKCMQIQDNKNILKMICTHAIYDVNLNNIVEFNNKIKEKDIQSGVENMDNYLPNGLETFELNCEFECEDKDIEQYLKEDWYHYEPSEYCISPEFVHLKNNEYLMISKLIVISHVTFEEQTLANIIRENKGDRRLMYMVYMIELFRDEHTLLLLIKTLNNEIITIKIELKDMYQESSCELSYMYSFSNFNDIFYIRSINKTIVSYKDTLFQINKILIKDAEELKRFTVWNTIDCVIVENKYDKLQTLNTKENKQMVLNDSKNLIQREYKIQKLQNNNFNIIKSNKEIKRIMFKEYGIGLSSVELIDMFIYSDKIILLNNKLQYYFGMIKESSDVIELTSPKGTESGLNYSNILSSRFILLDYKTKKIINVVVTYKVIIVILIQGDNVVKEESFAHSQSDWANSKEDKDLIFNITRLNDKEIQIDVMETTYVLFVNGNKLKILETLGMNKRSDKVYKVYYLQKVFQTDRENDNEFHYFEHYNSIIYYDGHLKMINLDDRNMEKIEHMFNVDPSFKLLKCYNIQNQHYIVGGFNHQFIEYEVDLIEWDDRDKYILMFLDIRFDEGDDINKRIEKYEFANCLDDPLIMDDDSISGGVPIITSGHMTKLSNFITDGRAEKGSEGLIKLNQRNGGNLSNSMFGIINIFNYKNSKRKYDKRCSVDMIETNYAHKLELKTDDKICQAFKNGNTFFVQCATSYKISLISWVDGVEKIDIEFDRKFYRFFIKKEFVYGITEDGFIVRITENK